MKLIDRIKAKTPKKNKLGVKVSTILGAVSLVVAESGIVDNRPVIKIALQVLSLKLGAVAVYNAQKVEENGEDK
jgi:hypothetical protein